MFTYDIKLCERAWEQLVLSQPKPPMMTPKRIQKAKEILLSDEHFLWDMLDRHGLKDTNLCNLDKDIKEHAISNFWGHLCSTLYRK